VEALRLVDRVVEFVEGVAVLVTADVELEAVRDVRVLRLLLGQRRDLKRVIGHEDRLDQLALAGLLEDLGDELALAPLLFHLDADALRDGAQVLEAAVERDVLARTLGGELDHGLAGPGALEVDDLVLIRNLQRAAGCHGSGLNDAFRQLHHALEVAEGAVGLHRGELGVVRLVHALVAEDAAELVHALETAHEQALQRQLGGDAQVVVAVERVQVRHERLGVRAAHDRLQERGLHLVVAQLVLHVAADGGNDLRAFLEDFLHLGVRDEVDVALAVADFLVREAVELLGQRAQALRQQLEALDGNGELAAAGLHNRAPHADPVAHVEVLQLRVGVLAERVDAAEQLDLAGGVAHGQEAHLALDALRDDATAHLHGILGGLAVLELRICRLDVSRVMRVVEGVAVGVLPRLDHRRALCLAHLDGIVFDFLNLVFLCHNCSLSKEPHWALQSARSPVVPRIAPPFRQAAFVPRRAENKGQGEVPQGFAASRSCGCR